MAKKTKRDNGYYSLNFTYEGKRYCVYAKQQKDLPDKKAEKILKIEQEKARIENSGGPYNDPTLDKFYERFTELRRAKVRETTIRAQKSQFKLLSSIELDGKRFGDFKLRSITRIDVLEVQRILQVNGQNPQNINQSMAHLAHILNEATKLGFFEKNPAGAIERLKFKNNVPETTHRALTDEEVSLFFAAAKESFFFNAFQVMINTGIRLGEMAALYPTDIDMKNRIMYIRRTVTQSETSRIIGDSTKTESGVRDFEVNATVMKAIKDQEELNRMLFGFSPGTIFRGYSGGLVDSVGFNAEIKRICMAAGIEPFTSHAFRHTYATRWMNERPEDFMELSKTLGHKNVGITLNLYSHVIRKNTSSGRGVFEVKTV